MLITSANREAAKSPMPTIITTIPAVTEFFGVDRLFVLNMNEARINKIEGIQIHKNSLTKTLSPHKLKKALIPIGDISKGLHGEK